MFKLDSFPLRGQALVIAFQLKLYTHPKKERFSCLCL